MKLKGDLGDSHVQLVSEVRSWDSQALHETGHPLQMQDLLVGKSCDALGASLKPP